MKPLRRLLVAMLTYDVTPFVEFRVRGTRRGAMTAASSTCQHCRGRSEATLRCLFPNPFMF
jgi:hypothetical protein